MTYYATIEYPKAKNKKTHSFYLDYFLKGDGVPNKLNPGIFIDWIYFYNPSFDFEICVEAHSIDYMVEFNKKKETICVELILRDLFIEKDILYDQMLDEIKDFDEEDEKKINEFIKYININEFIRGGYINRYCFPYSKAELEELPPVKLTSFMLEDVKILIDEEAHNEI